MLHPLLLIFPFSQPASKTNPVSVSMDLPVPNIPRKGHHTINTWLLWLASHIFRGYGHSSAHVPGLLRSQDIYVRTFQKPLWTSHSPVFTFKVFVGLLLLTSVLASASCDIKQLPQIVLNKYPGDRDVWIEKALNQIKEDKLWEWILTKGLPDRLNGNNPVEMAFVGASNLSFLLHCLLDCYFHSQHGCKAIGF